MEKRERERERETHTHTQSRKYRKWGVTDWLRGDARRGVRSPWSLFSHVNALKQEFINPTKPIPSTWRPAA